MRKLCVLNLTVLLLLGIFAIENQTPAAEQYPVKPISYIVAVEAGAGGDILSKGFSLVRPIHHRSKQTGGRQQHRLSGNP